MSWQARFSVGDLVILKPGIEEMRVRESRVAVVTKMYNIDDEYGAYYSVKYETPFKDEAGLFRKVDCWYDRWCDSADKPEDFSNPESEFFGKET